MSECPEIPLKEWRAIIDAVEDVVEAIDATFGTIALEARLNYATTNGDVVVDITIDADTGWDGEPVVSIRKPLPPLQFETLTRVEDPS